jgi:hypothetical protein
MRKPRVSSSRPPTCLRRQKRSDGKEIMGDYTSQDRIQRCLFFGFRMANWRSILRRLAPYHHKLTIVPTENRHGSMEMIESTAKMRPKEVQKRCSGPPSKNDIHSKTLMTRPTPRYAAFFSNASILSQPLSGVPRPSLRRSSFFLHCRSPARVVAYSSPSMRQLRLCLRVGAYTKSRYR